MRSATPVFDRVNACAPPYFSVPSEQSDSGYRDRQVVPSKARKAERHATSPVSPRSYATATSVSVAARAIANRHSRCLQYAAWIAHMTKHAVIPRRRRHNGSNEHQGARETVPPAKPSACVAPPRTSPSQSSVHGAVPRHGSVRLTRRRSCRCRRCVNDRARNHVWQETRSGWRA